MKRAIASITIKGFALLAVFGTASSALAQDTATAYPKMAPIDEYLMDRDAEIARARSAAPCSLAIPALVFGRLVRLCNREVSRVPRRRHLEFHCFQENPLRRSG